ncbi:MAG: lipopolysaccharide assembly protein LapA domain-containing protein [Actinomycetota bacterium]|nr:lipopolysaccharide assembly protein LapA domain-containing protein [Actinomycetota bacterium]
MRREEPDQRRETPGQPAGDDGLQADKEHFRQLQRARQGRVVKTILALALAVIFIVFILTNSQAVTVNFVFVKRQPPLIWVMFGCAVVGGIFGYLVGRPGKKIRFHRRRRDEQGQ